MALAFPGRASAVRPATAGGETAFVRFRGTDRDGLRTVRAIAVLAVLCALGSSRAGAQPGSPFGTAQLQVSGARLTLYRDTLTTDAAQTLNVGEAARVRTCYGTGAACGTAAPGSVPGLKVVGDLSGPELPQAIPYEAAPGGTFFLPGFQREGDYLLENIRLVETATGRVLANAEPSLATLHVRQILLASATVTRLTLADLQARGITITQQDFNAFRYVGGPGGPDGAVPGAAKWKLGTLTVGTDPGSKNLLAFGDPGAPGSSPWGQFRYGYDSTARDGTKLGRAITTLGLAAGSLLSNQGFAYGVDNAKRLTAAYAGPGSVTGADASAAIAAFERFKYEYGTADQLKKETREIAGRSVGYDTGGDGRPDARTLDPDLPTPGPKVSFAYDGLKRRIADDRFTFTWHYDGKIAEAVVNDCWPIEHGESQGPDCSPGYTRPVEAGHKLVFSYDALSRLLTRTRLGEIPQGKIDAERPFIETREYLFDGNTLLAEVAKAEDGTIRWRKTYVPGADLHDHVQVRVETYDVAQNLLTDRLYAYIRDEQGTVLALADEASDPKSPAIPIRYLYSPYGNAHAETGPELRKAAYAFGITSVKDPSGATKTQTATGSLPGGIRLSFGIDVDGGTFGGILLERRETDGTWGALNSADLASGRAADAANSDVDILPLNGFAFATAYRVRTTSALKDIFGRTLADPKVLELPQTPAAIPPDQIGASSFEYDRRFPIEYDSLTAAANDANGLFPGGQPMGFQGQYTDPLLGFLLTPNRVYDARNGAWLSQDPLGDKDSPNLYGFVAARPHEATDPLGLGLFEWATEKSGQLIDWAQRKLGLTGGTTLPSRPVIGEVQQMPGSEITERFSGQTPGGFGNAFRREVTDVGSTMVAAAAVAGREVVVYYGSGRAIELVGEVGGVVIRRTFASLQEAQGAAREMGANVRWVERDVAAAEGLSAQGTKLEAAAGGRSVRYKRGDYVGRTYRGNRPEVLRRDPVCQYCQKNPSTTVDHAISAYDADAVVGAGMMSKEEAAAAVNELENLLGACRSCNSAKGRMLPGNIQGSTWLPENPSGRALELMKRLGSWVE